jgi:hypothetical protein
MDPCVLQVNYKVDNTVEFADKDLGAVAEAIAAVPGLRWKIWLFNEATGEGGGLYLFEDNAALTAFAEGAIIAALKSNPAITGVSMKSFGINEAMNRITRGPVAS